MSNDRPVPEGGAAAPPTLRPATLAAAVAPDALRALPHDLLATFLAGRRWFGAKSATPRRVTVHDAVPLGDVMRSSEAVGELPPTAIARLEVELRDGRIERYQLPIAVRELGAAGDRPTSVLAMLEAADGRRGVLFDALEDAAVRRLIAHGLRDSARYTFDGTSWILTPEPGVAGRLDALTDVPSVCGGAEQSNSSVVYEGQAILKLYRKLEAGTHPDVEMARALTGAAGFEHVPRLLGTVTFEDRDGAVTVAGMLQRLVEGASDGWTLALAAAGAFIDAAGDSPPDPFARQMGELGRVTRALHEALASLDDEPAFATRAGTASDVQEWAKQVSDAARESSMRLARARDGGRLAGPDVAVADAILRRRTELLGDVQAIAEAVGARPGDRIRHHGDYHLGQVLRGSDGRFMIIDFEGEPARLLAERRATNSALRDVAGMLRSFSYAAAAAAMAAGGVGMNPTVEIRSARWERGVREAFLGGYLEKGTASFLPGAPSAVAPLILLFEMEKVFYELAYELDNRPSWVWIPLRGIGKLLGSPAIPRRRG